MNILGASPKTSIQGYIAGAMLLILMATGLTGTPVPKIVADPETGSWTLKLDENGEPEYTEPKKFDPALVTAALAIMGIGRAARDGNVSSQQHKIRP